MVQIETWYVKTREKSGSALTRVDARKGIRPKEMQNYHIN